MYPSAMPGDTQKRTLAPDDQDGLCTIYPVDHPPPGPNETLRGGVMGCAVAGSPRGPLSAAAMAAGVTAILLRRRRRRA
jgi:MYXO-CTERM domain-containing protein